MDQADARWRAHIKGDVPHLGAFEQHLLIWDIVEDTNIPDLPTNINRFMTGAVTLDIVGSERSLMTWAKLGRFMIFGIVQSGLNRWHGTKVHVRHGVLKPGKFIIPVGLLDLFREKAAHTAASMAAISPAQRAKIDETVLDNIEAFSASDQFAAIEADARLFGEDAVLWKNPS
jgi:hypothetical protein